MKKSPARILIVLLLHLVFVAAAHAQTQTTPSIDDFSGKWSTQNVRPQLTLNFIDSVRMTLEVGKDMLLEGRYRVKMRKINENIILRLRPTVQTSGDSLVIIMKKTGAGVYNVKSLTHFYADRPPESELLDNQVYELKKED